MSQVLRILIAEDNPDDAELLVRALRKAGFRFEHRVVDSEVDYVRQLSPEWDVILSDYEIPQFGALRALELLKERALEIPFVIISGTIGEDLAVAAMKMGAADYLLKDRLARLGPAVAQAVEQGRLRKESRKTLAALQTSEEALRVFHDLVDQANDTFEIIEPETGRFLDVNAKGAADSGYTREEYLTLRVYDLDPTICEKDWPAHVAEFRRTGGGRGEGLHRRKDGTTFPIEYSVKWVELGRAYVVASIRDITARKQAEAVLRESERRFREMLENVELIAITLDSQGVLTFCNECLLKFGGWTREEVVGQPWFSKVVPDDPRAELAFAEAMRIGQAPGRCEAKIKTRQGEFRDVVWSHTMLRDSAGAIVGMAGIGIDVTDRKRSEERLQEQAAMLDQTHDAIIVRGFYDGKITFWSQGAERIYGWSVAEALGRDVAEFIHVDPNGADDVRVELLSKDEWHGEKRHRTKDGRELIMSTRATLVRDGAGEPKSVLSINADVTEQKNLELRFLRAQRMESIGTLASGVAHDLNNILAPIMMVIPLLRTPLARDERDELLATVETSVERGAQIVQQVLTFGRGVEMNRTSLRLNKVVNEISRIIHETFPKNIILDCLVPDELWSVVGDAPQLNHVLLNLCVNARDAMPWGGMITLRLSNLELDQSYASMLPGTVAGPYVLIEVRDTGVGIPADIQDRIFDPFFTTKGVGNGTGLGLSTALGIVKSHGGHIHVSSRVGQGTTFQVYLPAEKSVELALEVSAPEVPRHGKGEWILIVDDEQEVRNSTKVVLEKNGYQVLAVADGAEAMATFARNIGHLSLVLTDMMMPYMDGVALVHTLRKLKPNIPIIASTGMAKKGEINKMRSLGVRIILDKPYGAPALLKAVHESLSGHESIVA